MRVPCNMGLSISHWNKTAWDYIVWLLDRDYFHALRVPSSVPEAQLINKQRVD